MNGQQKYLYVLFSATPYRMGYWIRVLTGEPYNHVSIATEDDLHECYGFARRYYRTPFYGGFVTESPCRYRHNGNTAMIKMYRLPLTDKQWQKLQSILTDMKEHSEQYIYNHLSIVTAPLHRKVRVRKAYTCAEFVVSILSALGFDFDVNQFYSIGGIAQRLENYHVYTGKFPAEADSDPHFFHPHPLPHPIASTARNLLRLIWRKARA